MANLSSLKLKIDLFRMNRKSEVKPIPHWHIYVSLSIAGAGFIIASYFLSFLNFPSFVPIPQISQNLGSVLIATGIFLIIETRFYKKRYDGINRPPPNLYLDHVTSRLYLMGITLHDFRNDSDFTSGLMDKSNVSKRWVDYKFLILFPLSQELSNRETEEKIPSGSLLRECKETLRDLLFVRDAVLRNNPNNKFDIRFYNIPPRRSMIITDDPIFIGPYLYGKRGFESKWTEISNKDMYHQYLKEFGDIWNVSCSYDYNEYSRTSQIEDGYKNLKFP